MQQDWLFASGGCEWRHDFARRERIDFADGPIRAFMEESVVLPGVTLFRAAANGGRSDFRIAMEKASVGGRMVLGCMLSGAGTISMEGCDSHDWREEGRFFTLTPVARRVAYDVRAEADWRAVAVCVEGDGLDILGANVDLPRLAVDAAAGRISDLVMSRPLAEPLRALAHDLLQPRYAGSMGRLHRKARTIELLAHQLDMLERGQDGAGEPGRRELARVREARELLMADLREPPDLDALAGMVGLTAKQLNRGFRLLYGTTVFDYLRDARLEAARVALLEGSTLPLKQLAWALGYNQASNFVTAFKRRFGVSPGVYRRGREE